MNPWLPTLLIVGAIIATILIVRSLSHAGKAAVRVDWVDADVPGDVQ